MVRREFNLPSTDVAYLGLKGYTWETIRDGSNLWLVIRDFPIPKGYNVESATTAVLIPASYPSAPLDMVWFNPSLLRADGKSIPNVDHHQNICGNSFQRWSRHMSAQNPWRCGIDDISSILCLAEEWLQRELNRG